MVKILIVDDHPVFRRGLKEVLSRAADFGPAGEAEGGRKAIEMVRKGKWDAVVLDISLPDKSGMEVLKEIKHEKPRLPVLVLSAHPEDQYALRALKAGAAGYITKEKSPDEIVGALKKVLGGGRYVSESLAESLAVDLSGEREAKPHEKLSDREYQVLSMIASGKAMKKIAKELFLSARTVSTYRSRLLKKMNMKSNAELIRYALDHKLSE